VLDDNVIAGGLLKKAVEVAAAVALAGLVDDGGRVAEVVLVAVLLATVSVRFGEGDVVAEAGEVFVASAVIGGGAVPVRADDRGAKGEDAGRGAG
jgi:hypothetical protein